MMSATAEGRSPKILGSLKGYTGDFCCVPECSNSRGKCNRMGKKISFYQFPKDEQRREAWLKVIRRDSVITIDGEVKRVPFSPKKSSRVCSAHFVKGAKVDIPGHQDYIPSVFPRKDDSVRLTKRSKLAGNTGSPNPQSKQREKPAESAVLDSVRNTVLHRFYYFTVNSENSVWNTTDHDYVEPYLPQLERVSEMTDIPVSNLNEENMSVLKVNSMIENVKDVDSTFQFDTNSPNYKVFIALPKGKDKIKTCGI